MSKSRFAIRALLAAAAITAASGGTSVAADLPIKSPARTLPIAFNWTGCYLGAHVGYGWGRKHIADNANSDWFVGAPIDVDTDGFLGGGQIGCNYQVSPNFVIGIEGDGSGADISGSADVTSGGFFATARVKTNWLATLTGRVGVSFDRSLLYAKGGVAWAGDKYEGDWSVFGLSGTVSASETRTGWTIGAGWEYAFSNNWSAKVEYSYMDFGTETVNFPVPPPGTGTYIGDIDQTIHAVKVGINYRFGAYP